MEKIIFATKNRGKIKEVKEIFSDADYEILAMPDLDNNMEVEESAETFEGNAKLKAKEVYAKFKIPVMADDSGIAVEQLEGKPGVYSARYAGENATDLENNLKLIRGLKNHPNPHLAKYVCVAVYFDGADFIVGYGEVKGKITDMPKGSNGFGYDPYFVPDGYSKTMAELPPEEKNSISHRGKAFNQLKEKIKFLKVKK
jgi:XTP/dITP diphosphohydrolase